MTNEENKIRLVTMTEFLVDVPPGLRQNVAVSLKNLASGFSEVDLPKIKLPVDHEHCNDTEFFLPINKLGIFSSDSEPTTKMISFRCVSWSSVQKHYVILVEPALSVEDGGSVSPMAAAHPMTKVGELPSFGPGIGKRLQKIAGDDLNLLRKADRCQALGLGIAAFAYYRRVVEDRRVKLFNMLIQAIKVVSPSDDVISELEAAKSGQRFAASVDTIKSSLPDSLLINGQSPLKLLHGALSVGLHELSDDECLELASDIRSVLTELIERVDQIATNNTEVKKAAQNLSKLMRRT